MIVPSRLLSDRAEEGVCSCYEASEKANLYGMLGRSGSGDPYVSGAVPVSLFRYGIQHNGYHSPYRPYNDLYNGDLHRKFQEVFS